MKNRREKPSQTGRRREPAATRRRARAFYKARKAGYGDDVLDREEAEGLAPWRGCGAVLLALAAFALVGWAAARLFS